MQTEQNLKNNNFRGVNAAATAQTRRTKCYVTALVANCEHSDFFVDVQNHLSVMQLNSIKCPFL
jgi:hypothetical protein